MQGGGAVATKASFNMLGGGAEFDIDFSGVQRGVNANIYTVSPTFGGSFTQSSYCDGSPGMIDKGKWCMEVDWIESNGNCGAATTLHTKNQKTGNDGCTAWGCRASYTFNGKASFHMRIEYGTDGTWTTIRDGQTINAGMMSPRPSQESWNVLKSTYESKGGVLYSSEWVGWVPETGPCGGNAGNSAQDASHFTVSNLKVTGSIAQGPQARKCSELVQNHSSIVV